MAILALEQTPGDKPKLRVKETIQLTTSDALAFQNIANSNKVARGVAERILMRLGFRVAQIDPQAFRDELAKEVM